MKKVYVLTIKRNNLNHLFTSSLIGVFGSHEAGMAVLQDEAEAWANILGGRIQKGSSIPNTLKILKEKEVVATLWLDYNYVLG